MLTQVLSHCPGNHIINWSWTCKGCYRISCVRLLVRNGCKRQSLCVLLLLSLGLFGSLTYCVWNKQTELASELQNELHMKLRSELADVRKELCKLQNDVNTRMHLQANEPSHDKPQLKRNVQQADEDTDTPSATELLTNALT